MVVLASFTQPTDGIRHRQNNTTVYVNDNNLGKGTLYIAESRLSWVSDSGNGFSIEYPHISLHAVSRDLSSFPQECLFLMLDTALGDEEMNSSNENENGSDEQETTELRLVPDDKGMLDAMFHAMNACQALHPDPDDSFSDEDFFEDADDEIPMDEADSQMARLRIENTDGRRHMLNRSSDTVGGGMNCISENIVEGGRVHRNCISGDMLRNREVIWGRLSEEFSGNGEVSNSEGRVGGILEGRAEGILGDRAGGILGDRAEGILGDRVGGISEDRVGDISEGRVADNSESRLGDWFGRVSAADMAQGDRSLTSDNTWRLGRMADFPAAHSLHMDPEEDSNFADAEN